MRRSDPNIDESWCTFRYDLPYEFNGAMVNKEDMKEDLLSYGLASIGRGNRPTVGIHMGYIYGLSTCWPTRLRSGQ